MSERIANIKRAIERKVGGIATHVGSKVVTERFQGKIIWEGVVEMFDLAMNPKVKRCYAWMYRENGEMHYETVNETEEVNSPELAVKEAIGTKSKEP